METGAIEMCESRGKAQALGGSGGNEAVEFGDPIVIERYEGTSEGIIIKMVGSNGRRDEARGRFIVKKMRHEVELLVDEAYSGFHISVWQDQTRECPPCCSLTLTPPSPRGRVGISR